MLLDQSKLQFILEPWTENLQYYVSLFWRNADRIIWLCSGHVDEVQIRLI